MDLSISMPKYKTPKKILIALLATLILWMGIQPPPKADAFLQFAAVGAVEVGVLAFWGGAVLVATVGVAVGLDPAVGEDIQKFGKAAFTGANKAIKDSISWSVSKMKINTSSSPSESYAVQFTPEVKTYLQDAFADYFFANLRLSINPKNNLIAPTDSLTTYASISSGESKYLASYVTTPSGYAYKYIQEIRRDTGVNNWIITLAERPDGRSWQAMIKTYPYKDAQAVLDHLLSTGVVERKPSEASYLNLNPTVSNPIIPDVISPALPANIPDVFTVPSPQGVLNPAGDMVDLATPTIGYPNLSRPANPWDVAVGYPAIPGNIASLNPADTITAVPNVTAPSVPTVPDVPDVTGILGWLNAFWTKFMQMLKDLFIPSAINFAPISNIWATRFPAIQSITAALQSLTVLNYEQSPPKFNFTISGKSYTFIDLTKVPSSWMNLAKMFIRISIWSAFIFMVLREWRPRPHLG